MEVRILLKQGLMPKFYRNFALSLVKEALKKGNSEVYNDFYETEKVLHKKPFSFDISFKGSLIGDFYLLEKSPILRFSTSDSSVLSSFLRGINILSGEKYKAFVSEHLEETITPEIKDIGKKYVSNVLKIPNFLLPYHARNFREKVTGLPLDEKVRFYFESQGIEIIDIESLKPKGRIKHKFRDKILELRPLSLTVKVKAESREKLMDVIYNGIGWFSSQGFGYVIPVRKSIKKEIEHVDRSTV